jgi:hypothetical protein
VLFSEQALERPAGLLDGSWRYGESLSFEWSGRGRRPAVLTTVRFLQRLIARLVTTAIALAAGVAMQWSFAGWLALAWFLGAGRLRTTMFGKSQVQVQSELIDMLTRTLRAIRGPHLPVAALRHVMQEASGKGVAFDPELWRLVGEAERRGEAVWSRSPGDGY